MSVHEELYGPFWEAFNASKLGPIRFANTAPEPKTNKDRFGYMVLGEKIGLGFRPIGTISKEKDRLGVELITSSRTGREFAESRFSAIAGCSLGEQRATLDYPGNETKIHITWSGAGVAEHRLWPAHHLWLRLGIDTLCKTHAAHIERFTAEHGFA